MPRLVIELALESAPVVRVDAETEEAGARLADWLESNRPLRDLVSAALTLGLRRAA